MAINSDTDIVKLENALKEKGIFVLRLQRYNWWLSNGCMLEFTCNGQLNSITYNSVFFPMENDLSIDDIVKCVICIKYDIHFA